MHVFAGLTVIPLIGEIAMIIQSSHSLPYSYQSNLTNSVQNKQNLAVTSVDRQDDSNPLEDRIDFSNISRSELHSLIKNGTLNLSDVLIMIPESGLDLTKDVKSQMDAVMDDKLNVINYIEKSIEYRRSINYPVDFLEDILKKMSSLQGQPMSKSVDTSV